MSDAMTLGFAMCGSFCTFSKVFPKMQELVDLGYKVVPIMSENAYSTDTRFGTCKEITDKAESITGHSVIHTIKDAEPIGPKKLCDVLMVAPCTGNTLAKISAGITDTSVTMAVKSQLRICRPVLIAIATNDALGASAQNIGRLLNTKNIFFVPVYQDDPVKKPNSLVSHFELLEECVKASLDKIQIQPMFR